MRIEDEILTPLVNQEVPPTPGEEDEEKKEDVEEGEEKKEDVEEEW